MGEDSPLPKIDGFRSDAVEALRRISPPVIQFFPQSPFYNWEDGIGPREHRPRLLLPWGRIMGHDPAEVSNDVGTDEFVRFCRLIGAEPFIDTNESDPLGSRNLVEYCNYDGGSRYARLRAEHGHAAPYRVKYWHPYRWGGMDAPTYGLTFGQFAAAARLIDPSIEVIASGVGGEEEFLETLGRAASRNICGTDLVDHMAYVHYFGSSDAELTAERYERIYRRLLRRADQLDASIGDHDAVLRFYSRGRNPWGSEWLQEPYRKPGYDPMGIVVSEWGVTCAPRKVFPLSDAIVAAGILDTYHRWANRIHMALLCTLTYGHPLIKTDGDKLWVTPTYHLFDMYMAHRENESIAVELDCDGMEVEISEEERELPQRLSSISINIADMLGLDIQGTEDKPSSQLPVLSSSASMKSDSSQVVLSITNRHLTNDVEAEVTIRGAGQPVSGTRWVLSSDDVRDYNDAQHPERVLLRAEECVPEANPFTVTLPPHSVTTFSLRFR